MTVDVALSLIRTELERAETKFPTYPTDAIHAAAIVNEEAGELVQAALQYTYEGASHEHMIKEAVQTATMGLRFILNAGTLIARPSEQIQRVAAPPAAGTERTCEWTEDEDTGAWATGCNRSFTFINDGPTENRYRYCPGCGWLVMVAPRTEEP